MKISVVMPVFNTKANYLHESVLNIFTQTYPIHEIIIVNDGSTLDETLIELDRMRNLPFVRVIDQENKNMAHATNTGIQNMTGDWCAFCSSDDRWFLNKIEEQAKFIESNPGIKVVYCDWEFINNEGFSLRAYREPEFKNRFKAGKHIIRAYFGNWSGMMIHKSVFDDIGLFNENYPTRGDYEFNIRILIKYMMYRVPKILLQYRIHPDQVTSSKDLGTRSFEAKKYCEMARDLAIKHFGDDEDRKQFPLGRKI